MQNKSQFRGMQHRRCFLHVVVEKVVRDVQQPPPPTQNTRIMMRHKSRTDRLLLWVLLLNHVAVVVEAKVYDDGACHLLALLPFTSR